MDWIFIMYLLASLALMILGLLLRVEVYKETSKYKDCKIKANGVVDEVKRITTVAVGGNEITYIKHMIVRFSDKNGEMCAAMCNGGPGMSGIKCGDRVIVKYNKNDTEDAYVYVYTMHMILCRLLITAGVIVMVFSVYGLCI